MVSVLVVLAGVCSLRADAPKENQWIVMQLAQGYQATDGVAICPNDTVYFADVPNGVIYRFNPASGRTAIYRRACGYSRRLQFDPNGKLYACEFTTRQITCADIDWKEPNKRDAVINLSRINPNARPFDMAIDEHNGIYFTEYTAGDASDNGAWLYYATNNDDVAKLDTDIARPSSLTLSPKHDRLYVCDDEARTIYAFPLDQPGKLGARQQIATNLTERPDSMATDASGNLYVTGTTSVWVYSPQGELVERIELPENPSSCVWSADGSTLYVTAGKSLYGLVRQ